MKTINLSILIVLSLLSVQIFAQWDQSSSPSGGSTGKIEQVGHTIFISAYNSGVYQSTDEGITWTKSFNGLPPKASVQAICEDQGKVYIDIYQEGIYCSTDTGKTWTAINEGIEHLTCYSLFASGNEILAGDANGGAYYSSDGGRSWSVPEGLSNKNGIASQITDFALFNSKYYAACLDKLYELSDDKSSWHQITANGLSSVRTLFVDDSLLYIAGNGPICLATKTIQSIKPLVFNCSSTITNMKKSGNKVYLSTSEGRIFYTENDGKSWELIQNTAVNSFANDALLMSSGKYMMSSNQGLYISMDNGISWSSSTKGLNALSIQSLYYGDSILLAGTNMNGLFRSSDFGSSWQDISVDARAIKDLFDTNDGQFMGCEQGVFKSTDKGASWEKVFDPGINHGINALDNDAKSIVAAVNAKGVYISKDNGKSWEYPSNQGLKESSYQTVEVVGDTIFLSDAIGGVEVSTDGGKNWVHRSFNGTNYYTMKLIYNQSILYAATIRGIIYSKDLGQSWEYLLNDTRPVKDFILNDDKIFLATDQGVYISSIGEDRWFTLGPELEEVAVTKIVLRDSQLFAGTFSDGIWKMDSWEINAVPVIVGTNIDSTLYNEGDSIMINTDDLIIDDLEIDTSSYEVIIDPGANYTVSSGNILKSAQGYTGSINVPVKLKDANIESKWYNIKFTVTNGIITSNSLPNSSSDLMVYPIPASNQLHVKLTNENTGTIAIRIFGLDGRMVYSEAQLKNSIQFSSLVDVSQFSKGVYLLSISCGTQVIQKKLMVE